MGSRGPIPKRSAQRRRANKKGEVTESPAGERAARPGEPPRSGKGSTTEAWITYARSAGHKVDDGASRAAVIALVDEGLPEPGVGDADSDWHPVARAWYESLARSGQSAFYEPSDWATAQLLAESMSRELKPQYVGTTKSDDPIYASRPPTGAALAAWLKGMSVLLATEGDRRRLQVELQRRPDAEDDGPAGVAAVTDIRAWKEALSG